MEAAQSWLWEVIKVVGLGLLLWMILSPFGWGVGWLIGRAMPKGVTDSFVTLWRRIPGINNPFAWLVDRLHALRERLIGRRRIRVAVDRLHQELGSKLVSLRDQLAQDLSALAQGGTARGDGTLIGLLRNFDVASEKAHGFETINEELPDHAVAISLARSRLRLGVFFSLIMGIINVGLLFVFFRELPSGIDIPGTRLDATVVLAFILPLAEFAAGFVIALNADENDKADGGAVLTKWVIFVGLAALEGVVFFLLFNNFVSNLQVGEQETSLPPFIAQILPLVGVIVGISFTLLQMTLGGYAGRALGKLRQKIPIAEIKQQVADANAFVKNLPQQFSQIDGAAIRARESVRGFLEQVKQDADAEAPLIGKLDAARDRFLEALRRVDPAQWSADTLAAEGDSDDALRMAWGTVFMLVGLVVAVLITSSLFADVPFFAGRTWASLMAATALAIGALVLLPGFLPRAAVVVEEGGRRQYWLNPGGETARWLAIGYAALVAVTLFWAGFAGNGWTGGLVALIALAALAVCAWLGGSLAQLLLGLSFLAQTGIELIGFGLLAIWMIIRAATLTLGWVAAMAIKVVMALIAMPVTLIKAMWQRRSAAKLVAA